MAYEGFKDLARKTASDKVLRHKSFNIDKNPKYDWYQRGLAYMIYKCFHKKSSNDAIKNQVTQNQQLDKELIAQASC